MATYRVQGPDGAVHKIEGPDDATPEQITAFAQKTFANAPERPTGGRRGRTKGRDQKKAAKRLGPQYGPCLTHR